MGQRTVSRTNARNRRALDPSIPRVLTPAVIDEISAEAADKIRVTFNGRVLPTSLPQFKAGAGGLQTVASMSRISGTVVEFTFTGEVQGTSMIVEEGDLGIRTPAGGFVPAGSYAIPSFP